jgi:metal-dependent HD superfamily phosphatase/phosphodiesterase
MNNSAGLFQVDELLKRKLIGSGIEKYLKVSAFIKEAREKSLLKEFEIG